MSETENLAGDFSWVEALKRTIWTVFDIGRQASGTIAYCLLESIP
jgi:hypothetical protein